MLRDTGPLHGEMVRQVLDRLLSLVAEQTQQFASRRVGQSRKDGVDRIKHLVAPPIYQSVGNILPIELVCIIRRRYPTCQGQWELCSGPETAVIPDFSCFAMPCPFVQGGSRLLYGVVI